LEDPITGFELMSQDRGPLNLTTALRESK